jgi:hypothetical protein
VHAKFIVTGKKTNTKGKYLQGYGEEKREREEREEWKGDSYEYMSVHKSQFRTRCNYFQM